MRAPVLVPLDGSPFGEQAIPMALRLARRAGVPIELVLVQELILVPESVRLTLMRDADLHAEMRAEGATYLQMMASRVRTETDVDVVETLLEGAVVEALTGRIEAAPPRMLVMSTHGRGGISRGWLGSVADALVRRVSVPVMLLRPNEDVVRREGTTSLRMPASFRHIVVPLDGTPSAEEALPEALRIAGNDDIELTLLQIIPPPVTYLRPTFTADVSAELLADLEIEAERYLKRIARGIARPGLTVHTRSLIDHNAARGILSFVGGASADLIVMATHARRGFARLVIGSVTDKVMRGATVPVLVMRPARVAEETLAVGAFASSRMQVSAPLPPL